MTSLLCTGMQVVSSPYVEWMLEISHLFYSPRGQFLRRQRARSTECRGNGQMSIYNEKPTSVLTTFCFILLCRAKHLWKQQWVCKEIRWANQSQWWEWSIPEGENPVCNLACMTAIVSSRFVKIYFTSICGLQRWIWYVWQGELSGTWWSRQCQTTFFIVEDTPILRL